MSWEPIDDFLDFSPVSFENTNISVCNQSKNNACLEILLGKIPEYLWQDCNKSSTSNSSTFHRPIRNYDTDSDDNDDYDISNMLNQLALPNEIPENFNQESTYKNINTKEPYINDVKLPLLMDSKYFKLGEKLQPNESTSASDIAETESNLESKFPTIFPEKIEETASSSTNDPSQLSDREIYVDYENHLISNSNYYRNLKSIPKRASKETITMDLTQQSNCMLRYRFD